MYPGQELRFAATRCNKMGAYRRGRCTGATVPMGLLAGGVGVGVGSNRTRTMPSGSYFLFTNGESPFGLSGRMLS